MNDSNCGLTPSHKNIFWYSVIPALRDMVAVGHGKDLFFRSWDNWASTVEAYTAITDAVPPHEHLYMSVKHSAADFTRPAMWNPTLGVGNHAQIVEVELQVRACEGVHSINSRCSACCCCCCCCSLQFREMYKYHASWWYEVVVVVPNCMTYICTLYSCNLTSSH